jgi:hypothetical protein
MGAGKSYSLHEIDDTRAAAKDQQFEDILERVKEAGGEIVKDEEVPMYTDIGLDEHETGTIRTVEFNLNSFDFQLIRKVETARITGEGRHKSLEPISPPRANVKMKKKKEYEDGWQIVDLEEMF